MSLLSRWLGASLWTAVVLTACGREPLRQESLEQQSVEPCPGGCPLGSTCGVIAGSTPEETAYGCVSHHAPYCSPCVEDKDCIDPFVPDNANRCIARADGSGSYCATLCGPTDDFCPTGSACQVVSTENGDVALCIGADATPCECSPWATERQAKTNCEVRNEFGACKGTRQCAADGLSDCDAAQPQAEICNNADDNCDGQIDDGFPTKGEACDGNDSDLCKDGVQVCNASHALECNDNATSIIDKCNNLDDDCDGSVDEDYYGAITYTDFDGTTGLRKGMGCGLGLCARGIVVCDSTTLGLTCSTAHSRITESCDGIDSDCDGRTDEELQAPPATLHTGVCAQAVKQCQGNLGWHDPNYNSLAGFETTEVTCDGLDNDCDGLADNRLVPPLALRQAGVCSGSFQLCVGELGWQEPNYANLAAFEVVEQRCDGLDNDCDGRIDTGLASPLASLQQGVCQGATQVCAGSQGFVDPDFASVVAGYEAIEVSCDGLDNDCDGQVDEDLTAPRATKHTGVCADLVQTCAGERGFVDPDFTQVAFFEEHELSCDGKDNDCDGQTDNNLHAPLNPNQNGVCFGSVQACFGSLGFRESYANVPGFGLPETPDERFIDDNCDGIDGDVTLAVFVSVSGVDNDACSIETPCRSLSHAVRRAQALNKQHMYVGAGRYSEGLDVQSNSIAVFGGYNARWQRAPRNMFGHDVEIHGDLRASYGQSITIALRDGRLSLFDLKVLGSTSNALDGTGRGLGSYALHALRGTIELRRVTVIAGDGASGAKGSNGVDAASTAPEAGSFGGNAGTASALALGWDDSSRGPGGDAARNVACAGESGSYTGGGHGGAGGTMDTSSGNWDATDGLDGQNALTFATGSYGYRGQGGQAGEREAACTAGQDGAPGRSVHGRGGAGGRGALVNNGYWFGYSGSDGTLGQHGSGGGGGGGSGGCDDGTDDYGAGGGGGGAGGCRAPTAGRGGRSGGGSFGVFLVESQATVFDSEFILGQGGAGGTGGDSGKGQPGSTGGRGGNPSGDAKSGGKGGDGAYGGHTGSGGGGTGGSAFAMYVVTSSTLNERGNTFARGRAGDGGAAGVAPSHTSPPGNAGSRGRTGGVGNIAYCTTPNNCP